MKIYKIENNELVEEKTVEIKHDIESLYLKQKYLLSQATQIQNALAEISQLITEAENLGHKKG